MLIESVMCLVAARLAIALLPMPWVLRRIGTPQEESDIDADAVDAVTARRVAFALRGVSRRVPSLGTCLAQALAGHMMLRRRGIPCTICLGVARQDGRLAAHAILRSGGAVLTGGGGQEKYTPIAAYGWRP